MNPQPHEVYLRFTRSGAHWLVSVQRKGGRRDILRTIRLDDADKVFEMARKGHAFASLVDKQAVDYALVNLPEGMTTLHLTDDQLTWLVHQRTPPRPPKVEM